MNDLPIRVLVAHAEPFHREGMGEMLAGAGLGCLDASGPEEVLERLGDPNLELLLLDAALAGGEGVPLVRRALRLRPNLKLVLLAGRAERPRVREALRLGAWDDLGRPLHEEDLQLCVRRALAAATGGSAQPLEVGPGSAGEAEPGVDSDGWTDPTSDPLESAADLDAELARAVCDAAAEESEPAALLAGVLRALGRTLPAAPAALFLRHEAEGDLIREAQFDGGTGGDRSRVPVGRGLTGTVFATGRLVATGRPEADPRFDAEVDTPEAGSPGPMFCLPLRIRGRVLGVFRAFLPPGAQPAARTGEVLSAALSAALRNALLYRSLLDSIDEVAEARRAGQARD